MVPSKDNSKWRRGDPIRLQFLTATNPSQFKDEKVRKSVRVQAMRHFAESSNGRGNKTHSVGSIVTQTYPSQYALWMEEESSDTTLPEIHYASSLAYSYSVRASHMLAPSAVACLGPQSTNDPAEQGAQQANAYLHAYPLSGTDYSLGCNMYARSDTLIPWHGKNIGDEVNDPRHDSVWPIFAAAITRLLGVNNTVDPFAVTPQYRSKELDSTLLVRVGARVMSSQATVEIWVPAVCQHPHLYLSAGLVTSTWIDMTNGCSGDSRRTALVKEELYGYLNERMHSPIERTSDGTLAIMCHLIAGEMWNANEKTLYIHCAAATRITMLRGGLNTFATEHHRHVALACIWQCNIICERGRDSLLSQNYNLPNYTDFNEFGNAPLESPLFCPSGYMRGFHDDPQCHNLTYGLLCDMRELTNLFIAFHAAAAPHENEGQDEQSLPRAEYDKRTNDICMRLASLPSAQTVGTSVHNNWIYEACRITALIYASSIMTRVSFSTAAEPEQNFILNNPSLAYNTQAHDTLRSRRLNETLYEALQRTNTGGLWGNMIGVFYWVTAVGAAASRTKLTVNPTHRTLSHGEAYAMWIRRCFILHSIRAVILELFQYSLPTVLAQTTLLRVQELLSFNDGLAILVV